MNAQPQPARHAAEAAAKPMRRWPLAVIAAPAATAIWSGWVGIGEKTGFGVVRPFPGVDWFGLAHVQLNTAITLPVGVEAYAAYAMAAWLKPGTPERARKFAKWSSIGSLALGAAGQIAYHLLAAARVSRAPWPVVVLVSCIPVAVVGLAAALTHLRRSGESAAETAPPGAAIKPSASGGASSASAGAFRPAPALAAPTRAGSAPLTASASLAGERSPQPAPAGAGKQESAGSREREAVEPGADRERRESGSASTRQQGAEGNVVALRSARPIEDLIQQAREIVASEGREPLGTTRKIQDRLRCNASRACAVAKALNAGGAAPQEAAR